ncbi:MAG: hypothetical protein DRJ61_14320 [Acidobacteria bacterium]|nr:MAG: hypothetical protein DRJ65_21780 [Acidobacteriota bacterium]RLE29537.1 MAG: hypothetical protein DRJ61_14320 [Acidobacteriota bacterium]
MPQLHLYVNDDVAADIKRRANETGMSVSRFLALMIRERTPTDWPEDWFDRIPGGWQGRPLVREPQGKFETRESFR